MVDGLEPPRRKPTSRQANSIREAGVSTQGVRLLKLEEGDRIAAATLIPEEEEEGQTVIQ